MNSSGGRLMCCALLAFGIAACNAGTSTKEPANRAESQAAREPVDPPANVEARKDPNGVLLAPSADLSSMKRGDTWSLFDGKTLGHWKVVKKDDFNAAGKVEVEGGALALKMGWPYTGIRWAGDVPRDNFEINVEAMRFQSEDIFCGLTVPVGKEHVTLVLGGWADNIVGLSSINGLNASENEATVMRSFEEQRWYSVCLRVTPERIEAWIDKEQIIDQERANYKFSIYEELNPIRSLGFFTWSTYGKLRNITIHRLGEFKADPM